MGRDAVEREAAAAIHFYGLDALRVGRRAEAVILDLCGHQADGAARSARALGTLLAHTATIPPPTRSEAVASLHPALADEADWAAEAVTRLTGLQWTNDRGAAAIAPRRHTVVIISAAVIALLAGVGGWTLVTADEPSTADERPTTTGVDRDTTTAATATTTAAGTTTEVPASTRLVATMSPVNEGGASVARTFTWDGDHITVTAVVTAPAGRSFVGIHREAVPGDGTTTALDPPPLASTAGILTYDLQLDAGRSTRLSFEVAAPGPPDATALGELIDAWSPRRDAAIPPIDDRDALPDPTLQTCSGPEDDPGTTCQRVSP